MLGKAQGFAQFNAQGAITEARIKDNGKNKTSVVEQIVGTGVDLKKIDFKYKLYSACTLEQPIEADFTQAQNVKISKQDESKNWTISVKQLKPASLPFVLSFSDSNGSVYNSDVVGWATYGTDETKPTVARFGDKNVSFYVAFDGVAKEVSYKLTAVGTVFDGKFLVEESADGKKWTVIAEYNDKNTFEKDSEFTNQLSEDSRFVRWTYADRKKVNVNLNDISIR
ncbi:hypothetical protein D0T57_11020 [Dysgonomonas sp. 511]|nr:hypothetical protein [Dysgonomonas sp. 511]